MCSKIDVGCDVLSLLGHVGGSVANSVFDSIASAFGNTAASAINWLWGQLSTSTTVTLGGANFELDLGIVVSIAVVLCLGLFVIQMAVSALRRDAGGIGRSLRGLVVATLGCAITLASLNVLLAGVDQLCVGIVKIATGDTIATLGSKIIGDAVFTTAFASAPTILILSLFAIAAVAIVWFALVIRKMLILITAIFAPIAFAGGVADLSRGWVRKWLEAMLALVFSKLILIIIFVIGLGVLGGMGSVGGGTPLTSITGEITGLLILFVAGFAPWMALRLVHFTGDHMSTLAQSAGHASAGASTVVGAPQKMAQLRYPAASLAGGHVRSSAPSGGGPAPPRGTDASSTHIQSDTNREGAANGGATRARVDDAVTPTPAHRDAPEAPRDDTHETMARVARHGGDTLGPRTTEPGAAQMTQKDASAPNTSASETTPRPPDATAHRVPHESIEHSEPLPPSKPAPPMPQPHATPLEPPEGS